MKELSAKSGLNQNIVNQINNIFAKYPQIKKVMLYGSRAKGNYKKGSDIDLSMLGEDLTYKIQLDVFDDLDELLLPYKIDLSVFDYLDNANLRDHIERVGVVFYEREISELPKGWEMRKFSEIGKVYNGNSINEMVKKDNYSDLDFGFPYIATKDISYKSEINYENGIKIPFSEKTSFKIAPKNTVLICAEGGSAGRKIGFTNQEVCFGNKLLALVANNDVDSRYVYHYYFSEIFQKHFSVELAGIIGGVSMNKFKNLEIPLPPLLEQQRIVAILDEAFLAINKAKANAEANLKNAKELFESYLQGVFENKGEDWEERKLGEICEIDPKKSELKGLDANHLVSFLPMKDLGISQNQIIPIDTRKLSEVIGSYTYFRDRDVLLAKVTPCFENGKLGIAEKLTNGIGFGSSEYIVFRPLNNVISEYVFYLLSSNKFRNDGKKLMFGTTGLKRLSKDYVKTFLILLPSIEEQQTIVQKLDALSTETKKLEAIYNQKINDLEELKKSILQKAFNGELKIKKL